jgi:hypothetical protein
MYELSGTSCDALCFPLHVRALADNLSRLSYNTQAALKIPTWRADIMELNVQSGNNAVKLEVHLLWMIQQGTVVSHSTSTYCSDRMEGIIAGS